MVILTITSEEVSNEEDAHGQSEKVLIESVEDR